MTIFDAEIHERALRDGADVPEQSPSIRIPLPYVGISNTVAWVDLGEGRRPYEVEIGVELPHGRRGIHMSRIRAVMSQLAHERFDHIGVFVEAAAERIAAVQASGVAQVSAIGREPLVTQGAASGVTGMEARKVGASARWSGSGVQRSVWMEATHMTACPCTQEYCSSIPGMGGCSVGSHRLFITHSQRAVTTLRLQGIPQAMAPAELAPPLQEALHLTQDLLKRPDEAELVAKAHMEPQFVEDAVRRLAAAVWERFGPRLPGGTLVEIESLSLESIHSHDVVCRFGAPLGEIGACLSQGGES